MQSCDMTRENRKELDDNVDFMGSEKSGYLFGAP